MKQNTYTSTRNLKKLLKEELHGSEYYELLYAITKDKRFKEMAKDERKHAKFIKQMLEAKKR